MLLSSPQLPKIVNSIPWVLNIHFSCIKSQHLLSTFIQSRRFIMCNSHTSNYIKLPWMVTKIFGLQEELWTQSCIHYWLYSETMLPNTPLSYKLKEDIAALLTWFPFQQVPDWHPTQKERDWQHWLDQGLSTKQSCTFLPHEPANAFRNSATVSTAPQCHSPSESDCHLPKSS